MRKYGVILFLRITMANYRNIRLHHMTCSGVRRITLLFYVCFVFNTMYAECYDQTLTATPSTAYLTSPGYPAAYTNNLTYEWLIESQDINEVVKLSVVDCNIEYVSAKVPSCQLDFLRIYDGAFDNATLLYDSCCMTSVPDMNSSSPYLLIQFVTDATVVDNGFRIMYYRSGAPPTTTTDSPAVLASASIFIVVGIIAVLVIVGVFLMIFIIYKLKLKERLSLRVTPVGGEEATTVQDGGQHVGTRIDEYTKRPLESPTGSPLPPPEVCDEAGSSGKLHSPRKPQSPRNTTLFDINLPESNTRGIKLPPVN